MKLRRPCPACDGILVQKVYYHDGFDPDDWRSELLYPSEPRKPRGVPPQVAKAYEAAIRVQHIEANAFAVLLRRVLELVCIDRGAKGKSLYQQLQDLADRGEIPEQLARMADGLRQLGNIGAHASAGELSGGEVPYLDGLCQAILEYVYYGPQLLAEVEKRLQELRN